MGSKLKNGDLVHVSDVSEDDALIYPSKHTFIGMDGNWFVIRNQSGRYEAWPYVVKCNEVNGNDI